MATRSSSEFWAKRDAPYSESGYVHSKASYRKFSDESPERGENKFRDYKRGFSGSRDDRPWDGIERKNRPLNSSYGRKVIRKSFDDYPYYKHSESGHARENFSDFPPPVKQSPKYHHSNKRMWNSMDPERSVIGKRPRYDSEFHSSDDEDGPGYFSGHAFKERARYSPRRKTNYEFRYNRWKDRRGNKFSADVHYGSSEWKGRSFSHYSPEIDRYSDEGQSGSFDLRQLERIETITKDGLNKMSKSQKDALAVELVTFLAHHGKMNINNFEMSFAPSFQFPSSQDFLEFLQSYDCLFHMEHRYSSKLEDGEVSEEDSTIIHARTNIRLCIQHSKSANSCEGGCDALHVCRHYMLSNCEYVPLGKKCLFGHNLRDEHNLRVLKKHLLHHIPPRKVMKLIRKPISRNSTTVPLVCSFYNNNGCRSGKAGKKGKPCPYLHVCNKFILGICKDSNCHFSHNIDHTQPRSILKRFGLDYGKHIILEVMRSVSQNDKVLPFLPLRYFRDKESVAGQESPSDGQRSPSYFKPASPVFQYSPQNPTRSSSPENRSRSSSQSSDEMSDVNHKQSNFHWRVSSKSDEKWSVTSEVGKKLENAYQKFLKSCSYTIELDGEDCEIDFKEMSGTFSDGEAVKLIRINTDDKTEK